MYQSPYKGFNREDEILLAFSYDCINPPIRGSIESNILKKVGSKLSINPPIRGSIGELISQAKDGCFGINPPIRGSIEQDNALFRNYNHKR